MLLCPKNTDIFDVQEMEMFFDFEVKITTLCWPKIKKKICAQDVNEAKSRYYDAQKIQIFFYFYLKSAFYDARKY